jgi:hypothetical protein
MCTAPYSSIGGELTCVLTCVLTCTWVQAGVYTHMSCIYIGRGACRCMCTRVHMDVLKVFSSFSLVETVYLLYLSDICIDVLSWYYPYLSWYCGCILLVYLGWVLCSYVSTCTCVCMCLHKCVICTCVMYMPMCICETMISWDCCYYLFPFLSLFGILSLRLFTGIRS